MVRRVILLVGVYGGFFLLVATAGEFDGDAAGAVFVALLIYAAAAEMLPRPWPSIAIAGPWALAVAWLVALPEGGLDCGDSCEGAQWGVFSVVAFVCVSLFVAGVIAAVVKMVRRYPPPLERGESKRQRDDGDTSE